MILFGHFGPKLITFLQTLHELLKEDICILFFFHLSQKYYDGAVGTNGAVSFPDFVLAGKRTLLPSLSGDWID